MLLWRRRLRIDALDRSRRLRRSLRRRRLHDRLGRRCMMRRGHRMHCVRRWRRRSLVDGHKPDQSRAVAAGAVLYAAVPVLADLSAPCAFRAPLEARRKIATRRPAAMVPVVDDCGRRRLWQFMVVALCHCWSRSRNRKHKCYDNSLHFQFPFCFVSAHFMLSIVPSTHVTSASTASSSAT